MSQDKRARAAAHFGSHFCQWCRARTMALDACGTPWCDEHTFMLEIMNWGHAHNWPNIVAAPYALAPGADMWRLSLFVGTRHQAETVHAYLFAEEVSE